MAKKKGPRWNYYGFILLILGSCLRAPSKDPPLRTQRRESPFVW
jgi:hypothetical protein